MCLHSSTLKLPVLNCNRFYAYICLSVEVSYCFLFFFLKVGDLKILINWEIRQNESFTSIIKIVISIDLKQ